MFENILIGGSFAFAAAIQPGPLQAFLISRVAATGWKRTLPACLAPPIGDVPIVVLVLFVLGPSAIAAWHERPSRAVALVRRKFVVSFDAANDR